MILVKGILNEGLSLSMVDMIICLKRGWVV